ncbi:hypothetical protein SAMN05660293_02053 [Dyadobacter psychrophilus]|uniref:Uncharacterized protein n=1 Tax=Dyadobacter psychrophilus TaxID=651661 RepID=A0A1T5DZX9_9BACT|nr:hypothetical protein SAMN05660293_02053 [Dyadobacter psychrophilus]
MEKSKVFFKKTLMLWEGVGLIVVSRSCGLWIRSRQNDGSVHQLNYAINSCFVCLLISRQPLYKSLLSSTGFGKNKLAT